MKRYKVIDLQKHNFMIDTHKNPMTANELRIRFWGLDFRRTAIYCNFTLEYIAGIWEVSFEEI